MLNDESERWVFTKIILQQMNKLTAHDTTGTEQENIKIPIKTAAGECLGKYATLS